MRKGIVALLGICLSAGIVEAQEPPVRISPPAGVIVQQMPMTMEQAPVMFDAPVGPPSRFWASADYLAWWIKDANTPALFTSGSRSSAGVLGQPGTSVLFGGDGVDLGFRSGVQATIGGWCDCDQCFGIEGSFFFLGNQSQSYTVNNPEGIVTARPFFNVNTGKEDAQLISVPGLLNGNAVATLSSELYGAEINGLVNLCNGCTSRLDGIVGFRYLHLNESLGVEENLLSFSTAAPQTQFNVQDLFRGENNFYGGQLGLRGEIKCGAWTFGATGKVAVGMTQESVTINGQTTITPAGQASTTSAGGLLAQQSNIGHYHRDAFTVVPEVGLNVSYQVTPCIRLKAGYSFLYWSDVARPGDQIDRGVNVNQIPATGGVAGGGGPARPQFNFRDSDFFAHGINVGIEFRY